MKLLKYVLGNLGVNCYVLINEKTNGAIAIDVGDNAKFLMLEELKHGFKITDILLTHGHFDHISGVYDFYKRGVNVYIGEKELNFIKDGDLNLSSYFGSNVNGFEAVGVKDGDELLLNGIKIKVLETPGHTVGSVSYLVEDNLFCGDAIFKGSFGRVDFPTGDAKTLVNTAKKIFELKGVTLYSGHGDKTLTDIEKETNPIFIYDNY